MWPLVIRFVGLLALYLLAAGKVSPPEILSGMLTAGLTAWMAFAVKRDDRNPFCLNPAWWRGGISAIPQAFKDSALVIAKAASLRGPVGAFEELPLDQSCLNDPETKGQQAAIAAGVSLAPNMYVVAFDGGQVKVHRLAPQHAPDLAKSWPAAKCR